MLTYWRQPAGKRDALGVLLIGVHHPIQSGHLKFWVYWAVPSFVSCSNMSSPCSPPSLGQQWWGKRSQWRGCCKQWYPWSSHCGYPPRTEILLFSNKRNLKQTKALKHLVATESNQLDSTLCKVIAQHLNPGEFNVHWRKPLILFITCQAQWCRLECSQQGGRRGWPSYPTDSSSIKGRGPKKTFF